MMENRRISLDVEEILIDEGKAGYIAKRGISEAQVFQVLWNPDFEARFYQRYNAEKDKTEFSMLGRIRSGRFLKVSIEHVEGSTWRLITAYWREDKRGEREYGKELTFDE